MKIVITDGEHEADYIIKTYKDRNNDLIVINRDEEICRYLSLNNDIPVMLGRSTRESDLIEAGAEDADLFIALSQNDMDNYVSCQTAKQLLHAKRCIARVMNPKNVDIFRKLGIDSVLCSTYLLGEQIRSAASVENLINSLTLDDNRIIILELRITKDLWVKDKALKTVNLSHLGSVSIISRGAKVLIPNGDSILEENDKVLVVTNEENREEVIRMFQRKAE
ncbi:MAG: NAD-binding protein [Erysipelotrichaceae bacterium]|nr:NAD-binding protein [Erysipelotrichaceae bacterium]